VREGYPPLGFLIYMPLYLAFRNNVNLFSYCYRVLNGILLLSTTATLYHVLRNFLVEKIALRHTLFYAALPSVVIANTYSNDVVSLLPAALAIYMMLKKRPIPCAVLLGLATLGKGFPIVLLLPALKFFPAIRDKVRVLGITLTILVLASFPFMLLNPLTYLSTFQHHASRGPWETVWALLEGYRSHGFFLHPFFDKFFYHTNLLKVYTASSLDHAIYDWKISQLPNLLTIGYAFGIIILTVKKTKTAKDAIALSGFLFINNMVFFKGYSTQFSMSAPFYLLLAVIEKPLAFLIPLEFSHLIQMISWGGIPGIKMETIRSLHQPLLYAAIIIRTIVFVSIISRALIRTRLNASRIAGFFKQFSFVYGFFNSRRIILFASATLIMASLSFSAFLKYPQEEHAFRSLSGTISLELNKGKTIEIEDLMRGDQIIVRLNTNTGIDVDPSSIINEIERGIVNQYNLKGSFDESLFFFRAESESSNLRLEMVHPHIPFRITDGLEKDLKLNITEEKGFLRLALIDLGLDGQETLLRLAYPCDFTVEKDFLLNLKYRVIEGETANIKLDVFDEVDEWLYTFEAKENLILRPESRDSTGNSKLEGDQISLIAIVFIIADGSSTTVLLEEMSIQTDKKSQKIEFYSEESEEIPFEIYVERDFNPSTYHVSTLSLTVILGLITLIILDKESEKIALDGG
jgi:hypothetical protein